MDEIAETSLLQRALIDAEASAAVALRVGGLPVSEALTVVFHGRRDLGTIQTYVAHGGRGAGDGASARTSCCASRATSTSPTPADRDEAERLYAEQARALRDALVGRRHRPRRLARAARGPRRHATSRVDRSVALDVAPARAPPAADRARRPEPHDRGHARLRRAHARRGPAADGDRLRASRTSRTSTRCPTTRSACLDGLPRARRRPRAAAWPSSSSHQEASVSASWSSTATTSPDRVAVPRPCAGSRRPHRHRLRAVSFFLGVSALLARALAATEHASAATCSSSLEAPGRAATPPRSCAPLPACGRQPRLRRRDHGVRGRRSRPGEVKILAWTARASHCR